MAGKARVHELAKELGVTSKEVLARLSEQGEFVKSASSTVEAPVARRLRESFGGAKPAADKVKADGNGAPAKKAGRCEGSPRREGARSQPRAGRAAGTGRPPHPQSPGPPRRRHRGRVGCSAPARPGPTPGPRPGRRPGPKPAPRTPRVGNNPFSSAQPVERPIPRPQAPRPGAPRPGGGPRPGASPGNMPPRPARRRPRPSSASRRRPAARSRWSRSRRRRCRRTSRWRRWRR